MYWHSRTVNTAASRAQSINCFSTKNIVIGLIGVALQVSEERSPSPPSANCCSCLASSAAALPASASRLASSLSCLADYQRKARLAAEEEVEAAKIIERSDDIRKPKNDPHACRYARQTSSLIQSRVFFKDSYKRKDHQILSLPPSRWAIIRYYRPNS